VRLLEERRTRGDDRVERLVRPGVTGVLGDDPLTAGDVVGRREL
jgi:hypothetical protein